MKIVRTDTRPARLALAMSTSATPRIARRAFRLVGGRWGGVHDLLLCLDPEVGPTDLDLAFLRAADPDFVISIDPALDKFNWDQALEDADIQPFDTLRLKERAERSLLEGHLFIESPTLFDEENERAPLLDYDRPGVTWRAAAIAGFPLSHTQADRVGLGNAPPESVTPVVSSRANLTAINAGTKWLVIGAADSLRIATNFWSLRALGARPAWRKPKKLADKRPPILAPQLVVHAPDAPTADVQDALSNWAKHIPRLHWSRQEPARHVPSGRAYFASNLQPVSDEDDRLLFSTPAPPSVDGRLRRGLVGVSEIFIQSDNPANPDGVLLTRNNASRLLLAQSPQDLPLVRITRKGVAGIRPIGRTDLITIPRISYKDAVSAPLTEAGYSVAPSDKGRYQQRSLQLARGLRFLSACFRNSESAHLLDLFFEHHLGHSPTEGYRRAVTFEDLRDRLQTQLRTRRKRLTKALTERADLWLLKWTDSLLERGLLVGGYVLNCPHCAHRSWYRIDDVDQHFRCERCAASTHIPADAIRSFHLNEAFYQLRLNNGEVVTLMLAVLRESAERSLLYLPEVSLSHPTAKNGEADVAALVDGDLVIAEAKSTNAVSKKEIDWYQYVARRARAKRLIFATRDRSKTYCAQLACDTCQSKFGAHHRDYAWATSTKERIEQAREKSMEDAGMSVETLCYQSLIAAHGDPEDELVEIE